MTDSTFRELAPLYRAKGLEPRPIRQKSKRPPIKQWQRPDSEWGDTELSRWLTQYGNMGIGVRLGTILPDGTKLAAVDIDRNEYVGVTQALLLNPVCGRIGAKGIAYLVRLRGNGKYRALKVKDGVKVGEILCDNRLLILPPTIHPDTEQPYRWIGKSLLETDFRELPLIEA